MYKTSPRYTVVVENDERRIGECTPNENRGRICDPRALLSLMD